MSDKKILSINMNEFTYSNNNNKTRKSQSKKSPQEKIRVKPVANRKQQTLRKQSLLNMIRKQQEERYKRLHNNTLQSTTQPSPPSIQNTNRDNIDKFNRNFDTSSRDYLDRLIKKHETNVPKNTTLRRYPTDNIHQSQPNVQQPRNDIVEVVSTPKYGCLKNGNLPTYRNYLNKTQTNRPTLHIGGSSPLVSNIPPNIPNSTSTQSQSQPVSSSVYENNHTTTNTTDTNSIIENRINDGMKKMSELKQRNDILSRMANNNKPKKLRRKKTLRRTYKVGRSTVAPKVSVLVSNKTIRNRVSTKKQLLKQTPIQDVKKYLIKHGIIRVGSITPNDVLRQMYESMSLVCGEIHNHNSDTLLYNYIHSNE